MNGDVLELMDPPAAASGRLVPPAGRWTQLRYCNRVVFGAGALERLGGLAGELGKLLDADRKDAPVKAVRAERGSVARRR